MHIAYIYGNVDLSQKEEALVYGPAPQEHLSR